LGRDLEDYSPDRVDALVWAVTDVAVDATPLRLRGSPPSPEPRGVIGKHEIPPPTTPSTEKPRRLIAN
jgi:hypothetical protein